MPDIYFTSDLHLHHHNAITHSNRPFTTVEEMNETIISNWNSVVEEDDTVYLLGDIYLNNPRMAGYMVEQLKGNIILIKGNHDKLKDIHRYFKPGIFKEIHEYGLEIKPIVNDIKYHIVLSHYPIWSWNRRHHGSIHLHGHCHFKDPLFNEFDKNGLSMDVGVDGNGFRPISLDGVIYVMNHKRELL